MTKMIEHDGSEASLDTRPIPRTLKEAAGHYAQMAEEDFMMEPLPERAMWTIVALMVIAIAAGYGLSFF